MGNYRKFIKYLLCVWLQPVGEKVSHSCTLFSQDPVFKINWTESRCSYHDSTNNSIVVEQGTPFYLKFEISAWPNPSQVDLYKDGRKVNISQANGTIFMGLDCISIRTVDRQSYGGKYKISASNHHGEGHIEFQLTVRGMCIVTKISNFTMH